MLNSGFLPLAWALSQAARLAAASAVNTTTCNGKTYSYNNLAGAGSIPGTTRDKYGDTIGGIGSSIAIQPNTWVGYSNGSYGGILWTLPDRGWNTNGTLNYQARVHSWNILLTPNATASVSNPSGPNLQFFYRDSVLLKDPSNNPTTGLDGDFQGHASFPGFPDLPISTFVGDGFGGSGSGGMSVPLDNEGLVYNQVDGTYWISDEYGPYIYHFSSNGTMLSAIRPPDAFIPLRNGTESWSADSPPLYAPNQVPNPTDPTQGRANNQGFEGLSVSPDGMILSALLQSALIQDGGTSKSTNFNPRLVRYNISSPASPSLIAEYVVQLPTYTRSDGKVRTAAQSEIHDLGNGQFLVLSRDSGAGRATGNTLSVYRHADIFDITGATNIVTNNASANNFNGSIASSKGKLASGITPATYCSFLDFNVNSELGKFGLHNGGDDNSTLLNEKWESLALVPQFGPNGTAVAGQWFLISMSDNDFITQNGYLNGGKFQYADASGANLDSQALVFAVTLPNNTNAWNNV